MRGGGLVWLLMWLPLLVHASDEPYEARVVRVHDGDTLWVQPLGGGRWRKLRVDGIDAPEICQSGGEASRDALSRRVIQQVIRVQVHRHDDYGRAVVTLTHEGEDLAAWLVAQGHAWAYHWRHSEGPYALLQTKAHENGLGLFSEAQPEVPRDFRRRHGPCERPAAKPRNLQ